MSNRKEGNNRVEAPLLDIQCRTNRQGSPVNPSSLAFASPQSARAALAFHQSIPGYAPTPLVGLPALAATLGVERIQIKDESQRFDLSAFKVLGASYAMARALGDRLNLRPNRLTFESLLAKPGDLKSITFVTATDGNHGRAVAWIAQKLGCKAAVYMPEGSSEARVRAVEHLGADVSIIDGNYDDSVLYAEEAARERGWVLLQDTAWPGYETVPTHIMQGYLTLLSEIASQQSEVWPTHVFVQAGVGSFAASVLAFLINCASTPKPFFVIVEPSGASCYFESIKTGDSSPHRLTGELHTIMAGLACGQPSLLGWEVLNRCADAFVSCADEVAKTGMRLLANPLGNDPRIVSGESGAVTTGLVYEVLTDARYMDVREQLRLNNASIILLISTEGDTDPDLYRRIVSPPF